MSQLTIETNVSEIVTVLPQSADLFRKLRIDYCCGGKISLREAAEQRELDPIDVLAKVQKMEEKWVSRQSMHPSSFGEKTLVAYIQEKYHESLREELPLLSPYVTKVARVHGERDPHLLKVLEIFNTLRKELIDHTDDEDLNVFPMILKFFENTSEELKYKLRPHVAELEEEHDNTGALFHELREITNHFTPPKDACGTYRLVYARLEQLEKDTFEHVHLENNILFERVKTHLN